MSWFSETIVRHSEKNGVIKAIRKWGGWQVLVDDCEQTGPEVHAMWNSAIEIIGRYRGLQKTSSVLLLGLGGGGELKNFYKAFKGALFSVIEYDPVMVALAKELKLYAPYPFPKVICEDAAKAVPDLSGVFDLIVVDLFKGATPSPLSKDEAFLEALESKLAPDGLVVVNVYRNPELLSTLKEKFFMLKEWDFLFNHLALFQKKLVPKAFSEGYLPVREWPDLNSLATIPPFFHPSRVGLNERGFYWRLWPFTFEKYHGDDMPEILHLPADMRAPIRVIMWQRVMRGDIPKEWISFSLRPEWKIGFVPLREEYAKAWSENARRNVRKWHKDFLGSAYEVEEVSFPAFKERYMQSTLPVTLRGSMIWEAEMRLKNPKTPVTFLAARRKKDGRIVAGIARMGSVSQPISYYLNGFFTREAKDDPVMVGLFDHWFRESLDSGIRFIDLGNFWKPGDDASWKGFSVFKGKFNPVYFFFPPVLYQFKMGKER